MITMDGKKYKVLESFGFNCIVDAQVKFILYDGKRTMVVGSAGRWRLWSPEDRTKPIRDAMARGWPHKGSEGEW